ncbi:hypothetical protein [Nocardia brasiliensis]
MAISMESAERGTAFVDYIGLFVPAGVVTGALIAAAIAWWNERRSPLDHLKTLIEIRKDWPHGVLGVEAIDYEIGRQAAKLSLAAGGGGRLDAARGKAAVERAYKRRRKTTNRLVFWIALATVVFGITVYWARQYPNAAADGGWVQVAVIAAVSVGALFELIRLVLDDGWWADVRTNLTAVRQALEDRREVRAQIEERERSGES